MKPIFSTLKKNHYYDGGHIDLIEEISSETICNSACYFESKEIWFWELK